ncbi:MAG: purple acid phosphatase family protein [Candidatus Dadabacteria bacterium]
MRILFLASIWCLAPVLAFCQPKGIHLSWNGTKKESTSSTIAITWLDEKQQNAVIEYGMDSTHFNHKKTPIAAFSSELNGWMNKARIKHLKPSTLYFYRIVYGKNNYTPLYHFTTAPGKKGTGKVLIGLYSDTQNNEGNLQFQQTDTIVRQLIRQPYNFVVHTGDIVENGSVIESWKRFFDVSQPLLANNPFMSVTGNHDVVNDTTSADFQKPFPVFYQLFNLPKGQLNYSYDYGKIHFVAVNSGWAQGAEKVNKVLFEPGSEDYRWLENDLAKARKNKNIQWVIFYCHYPIYSFGWSHIPTWADHIKPLLDKYQVDLCISGHRHVYERHKAIRGNTIEELRDIHIYDQPKGTVYITNGSAGGSLQGLGGSQLPDMAFTPAEKVYTYATMTIEGNQLQYHVYNKKGEEIDYFTIRKNSPSSSLKPL